MDVNNLILERMQRLMCLGLEGQPASELIEGTASIWLERLSHINPYRLKAAFDILEGNLTRWPTPATIIEALPTYAHTYESAPPDAPKLEAPVRVFDPVAAQMAKNRVNAAIEEAKKFLGITTMEVPEGYRIPENRKS